MKLYEASAGTGKTHKIVELYVEALDPRQLVVTFTKAAAAELRDRIRQRLAQEHPERLADFAHAEITTIHGFCGRLLAQYSAECGHPPDLVQVADASAALENFVADFWVREAAALQPLLDKQFSLRRLQAVARAAIEHPRATIAPAGGPRGELLTRLAEQARMEVPARLVARGEITFDGLLRAVHQALESPALCEALRQRYSHVYIDEFQDTDPVQWAIFQRVFEGRMTLIADPKQAIYSFRQADVFTYQRATQGAERAQLDTNFRSDRPLVQTLNGLFGRPGVFTHPTLEATPVQAHYDARVDGAPLRVRWLPRDDGKRYLDKRDAIDRVAGDVAADICVSGVAAKDCAVLTRSHAQAEAVRIALSRVGLAAIVRDQSDVFASAAATDWRRVLQAVAEPSSSGTVKAALATRLIGLRARPLAGLDDAAWGQWAERLRDWSNRWTHSGPLAVLYAVLDAPTQARLLGQAGGARYLTDLRHVAELQQAQTSAPAQQIEWLAARARDPSAQLRVEDDGDAVTIATVHASKGLAYPFVWVPFAWTAPRPVEPPEPVVYHRDNGLVLDLDPGDAACRQATAERAAEEMRLLYVAATRARHRLVLYWATAEGAQLSPLRDLLLPNAPLRSDSQIAAELGEWRRIAQVERIEPRAATAPATSAPALHLRAVSPPPDDPTWRRTSFSGLTRAAHGAPAEVEPDESLSERVPLARFIAGAQIGTLIHEVLEHVDFADPASVAAEVANSVSSHGLPLDRQTQLSSALQGVLQTKLNADFALCDVTVRLDELGFHLPVRGGFAAGAPVSPAALAETMRAHPGPALPADYPDRLATLPTEPFRGFLSGAIDLSFAHDGRWYLADYKSNHLGDTFGDYTPAALGAAVSAAHYVLQYHLYAVALHRYLRWRVPDYTYDTHFGGVYYLFLRGMSPHLGPRTGVFFDRPPAALVEGWSALLEAAP